MLKNITAHFVLNANYLLTSYHYKSQKTKTMAKKAAKKATKKAAKKVVKKATKKAAKKASKKK